MAFCVFYNFVPAKHKVQDINLDQIELKVIKNYKKERKTTTNFEPSNDEDVVNKNYLDEKISKLGGHLSILEKF